MNILCADLEGVFLPEIWINVAKKTGIEELRKTTRDEPDYDKLMKMRLSILDREGLRITDIQKVIAEMEPLLGAKEFLDWTRENFQIIVVSDTFSQFAQSVMQKLNYPTLFCNSLTIDDDGRITNYVIRQNDGKKHVVDALKSINYDVISFGDSYNDISMIQNSKAGILFKPPQNVIDDYPNIPVAQDYAKLKAFLKQFL